MTLSKRVNPNEPRLKVVEVTTKAVTPSAAQLAMIEPFLLRDFAPEDLYVREVFLANDQPDRSFEHFDRGYLRRFAETIIGKSFIIGHEHGSAPLARFFDAKVGKGPNDWQWLKTLFYMPISDANQLARDNIDAGVWSYVSIGAMVDYNGVLCDICNNPYYYWLADHTDSSGPDRFCPHLAGETYDGAVCTVRYDSRKSDMSTVEAVEGSMVYLGCQYDAAIAKEASLSNEKVERLEQDGATLFGLQGTPYNPPGTESTPREGVDKTAEAVADAEKETPDMNELEKLMEILGAKSAAFEDVEAATKALLAESQTLKTQTTELSETVAKANERIAELEPLAKEAEVLKDDLTAEITRLGQCVKEEAIVAQLLEHVTDPAELIKLRETYKAKWAEQIPPRVQAESGKPGADVEDMIEVDTAQSSVLPGRF